METVKISRALQALAFAFVAATMAGPVHAADLRFAVHPVLPKQETIRVYEPLVKYLEQATGLSIELVTTGNFLVHWQLVRRGELQLILDGPHFTGYRADKMGYTALAKFPAVVSYTLVANADAFILDASELVAKRIATTPSPALGALRLTQLFPNPMRQPQIVEADDSLKAAELALAGETVAAIIPTQMVARFPGLITVTSTEQVPAPALSASPEVSPELKERIRQALLSAHENDAGRRALEPINVPRFEPADNAGYAGQAKLLEGVWGY